SILPEGFLHLTDFAIPQWLSGSEKGCTTSEREHLKDKALKQRYHLRVFIEINSSNMTSLAPH
ncbi:MAG: hypothetical protein ABSH25_20865, partial [Syntrophorhabdales bacterium]